MTPTNEAGHGLPELPEPLISGGNDNSRPDLGRGCTGYTAAQVQQYAIDYAAADGGVRERARELLAREVDADAAATPGLSIEAERIRNGKTDSAFVDAALRAVSAALSSHRQAGEPAAEVRGYGDGGGVTMCWTSGKLAIGTKLYTAPPLSEFRELAERWRDGVGIDLETRLQCADELIALVEKGAGNA